MNHFARHALISIVLLAGCGSPADDKRPVRLAGVCYRIPEWNAMPMDASPVWPGFGSRESGRSLSLQFSSTEIARRLPGYPASGAQPGQKLLAGFFVPTSSERTERSSNERRMHLDIWYALGDFQSRALEPIEGTDLLRIYPLPGGPTWMVVTRAPDVERRDTHLQDEFWIATCSYMGPQQVRNCSLDVDVGSFDVSLHIAEADLPLRHQLASQAVQSLKAWQVPCD